MQVCAASLEGPGVQWRRRRRRGEEGRRDKGKGAGEGKGEESGALGVARSTWVEMPGVPVVPGVLVWVWGWKWV